MILLCRSEILSNKKLNELLDYYRSYCELTIWFKKIVLTSQQPVEIIPHDVIREFVVERNRILSLLALQEQRVMRKELNRLASNYLTTISNWSNVQRLVTNMV